MNRSPVQRGFLLIPFAFAWFALLPQARAACQEGCDTDNGNTFLGDDALVNNTTGNDNTATGSSALSKNTIGIDNTGIGFDALYSNTNGSYNTAIGHSALFLNTTGNWNTANGLGALGGNTTGDNNTASGYFALLNNTTGNSNTATGDSALFANTTGSLNIALGNGAGRNLTTGNYNIDIGSEGLAGESRTIRIGKRGTQTTTIVAGIRDTAVTGGVAVMIDANGRLGTITSSARFKEEIKPMDKTSEAILALKPVSFRYKKELDPQGIPQFGLVAEDVEKVNPDLVARDDQGKPYTVRYEAVNAMLLNEFLKEHRKGQEQDAMIAQLKSAVSQQQQEIEALTAGLQKVSAQLATGRVRVAAATGLELSRPAPQTVRN